MTSLSHIAVIVPARNEEDYITACLCSIQVSVNHLQRRYPHISCDTAMVLDRCTDRTAELVACHAGRMLVSDLGRVGAARHLGAVDALTCARHAGIDARPTWLANTDADSTVPESWLTTQRQFADAGYDAVIGTVTPEGLDVLTDRIWRQRHRLITNARLFYRRWGWWPMAGWLRAFADQGLVRWDSTTLQVLATNERVANSCCTRRAGDCR